MLDVRMTDDLDPAGVARLRQAVIDHNVAVTGYDDGRALGSLVHDVDGELVAGLDGFTWGGYAAIEWLWVREDHRGTGLGARLVGAAEQEAAARGCVVVRVDSHTFQAPGFYERLGYEAIGSAGDTPVGHGEVFFAKRLSGVTPEVHADGTAP